MTDTAVHVPGWRHIYSGKVRNLYEPESTAPGESDTLLVVATDRISAFDHILSPGIPEKGKILTQLSLWWFDRLSDELDVANHVVSTNVPAAVAQRAMIVKRLDMFPIEAIARGYLTGSGLAEYRQSGQVTGIDLPGGLVGGSKLEPAIFTPSAKAEVGEHDENISYAEMVHRIGQSAADDIREKTLQLYTTAERIAREAGIILADTKVEYGVDEHGTITLGDEVLTPDSSRFWDAATYQPGRGQDSFDKQFVRDWLASDASGWERAADTPPPELADDVVEKTAARYREAYRRLTGRAFN
ncbi:MAG: phosphoribosylaminoimidazolesuccinocarboxamide synthase [Micrococcaceae bacterium]|nr:phosphoribosylaminoimidazolesuccinocarboxamide synthase [Micrococcaceae bacterium]